MVAVAREALEQGIRAVRPGARLGVDGATSGASSPTGMRGMRSSARAPLRGIARGASARRMRSRGAGAFEVLVLHGAEVRARARRELGDCRDPPAPAGHLVATLSSWFVRSSRGR